ncbi:hypothetical protein Enr17x_48550 [Gimesia fumaroli]|uniref:Uncharacterized protein n=1 Tax=Gimesia fumaroli TaxID=2527976 RepID=A0A518II71_9PLAN|nr:hypothetical protein Enr17x_48550 [Gimesia fumaroli]
MNTVYDYCLKNETKVTLDQLEIHKCAISVGKYERGLDSIQ